MDEARIDVGGRGCVFGVWCRDGDGRVRIGGGFNGHALAVLTPFVRAEVMRHVEAWKRAGGAEVGVQREEQFPQVRWGFEVGEQVHEEVVWVRIARIGVTVFAAIGLVGVLGWFGDLAVVEDDDFVDTEDGESAGDLASQSGFEIVAFSTVSGFSKGIFLERDGGR